MEVAKNTLGMILVAPGAVAADGKSPLAKLAQVSRRLPLLNVALCLEPLQVVPMHRTTASWPLVDTLCSLSGKWSQMHVPIWRRTAQKGEGAHAAHWAVFR